MVLDALRAGGPGCPDAVTPLPNSQGPRSWTGHTVSLGTGAGSATGADYPDPTTGNRGEATEP